MMYFYHMAGNSFGSVFSLTTFGESHGAAVGGVVDGCPAGISINTEFIQRELNRRKPGQSQLTTPRAEGDVIELLSGIFEGKSTGAPIGFIIRNADARPADYGNIKNSYRPSHADFTWEAKFGIRDYRGGGRSSARETACRVAGGAIAKLVLQQYGVSIHAFVKKVGHVEVMKSYGELDLARTYESEVRCPDTEVSKQMSAAITAARDAGDSLGGVIQCVIEHLPPGIGEPVFDRLHAVLAHAVLSINAAKGFEIGSGFDGVTRRGSEENDAFATDNGRVVTTTNRSGGVQGGISNGMPVWFNVAFKPVSTISLPQQSVDREGIHVTIEGKGRHDPCVLPRAVPVVEAMAAIAITDLALLSGKLGITAKNQKSTA
jgi:chorismate synthase